MDVHEYAVIGHDSSLKSLGKWYNYPSSSEVKMKKMRAYITWNWQYILWDILCSVSCLSGKDMAPLDSE